MILVLNTGTQKFKLFSAWGEEVGKAETEKTQLGMLEMMCKGFLTFVFCSVPFFTGPQNTV